MERRIIYECGICSSYHPWEWDGDCREDENRYDDPEDYAEKHGIDLANIDIRSMDERVKAGEGVELIYWKE